MGSGIAQKMATEGFAVTARRSRRREGRRAGWASSSRRWPTACSASIFAAAEAARDSRADHRHVALRGSRATPTSSSRRCSRTSTIKKQRLRRLDQVCRPRRDPRHQHLVVRGHRARRRDDAARSASSGCTTSTTRRRTGSSRSSPGQATDPRGLSARVAAAGGARQDADRLERFLRLHRQPLLPAVAERGGAHARRRRRRHRHDRRGGRRRRSASAWDRSS